MNIVITGCSRGIGYELTHELLQNPHNKVLGISRNVLALEEIKKSAVHNNFDYLGFDLEEIIDKSDIFKNDILTRINRVDILINNAGQLENKPFNNFKYENVSKIFKINLFAVGEIIRILVPLMGQDKPSHVVNIGSMGGVQGSKKFSGIAWYSASKAALACLTECLAEEYKLQNIYFNCLALGAVQTEMLSKAFPDYQAPHNALEMAKYIAEFAVNGHKYFNGKILPVSISTP